MEWVEDEKIIVDLIAKVEELEKIAEKNADAISQLNNDNTDVWIICVCVILAISNVYSFIKAKTKTS